MLQTIDFYYFSPTGGTKKAGDIFCGAMADQIMRNDLTKQEELTEVAGGQLAVFAVPVFGGRIPSAAAEAIGKLSGQGKQTVTLVVYGNRAYEDALLELNRLVGDQGYSVVASAALLAQHSIVGEVAAGRPDEQDAAGIRNFAAQVLEKLAKGEQELRTGVPGNIPYKDAMKVTAGPITLEACEGCDTCRQVCPTGAISCQEKVMVTDGDRCILCMACVAQCPKRARILPPSMQEAMNQKLMPLKDLRRENEYFL